MRNREISYRKTYILKVNKKEKKRYQMNRKKKKKKERKGERELKRNDDVFE